jgi:hypothetical protein
LPEVLFEFTGYLLNNEIRERLSTYKKAFFTSVKAHEVPKLLAKYDLGNYPLQNE